ncbi:MAG: M20/M25/M40 family metallo-hydrolase [Steroidobacteraceae bacterium]
MKSPSMLRTLPAAALQLCALLGMNSAVLAQTPAPQTTAPAVDAATLARIRDTAMGSDWVWNQLTDLTDSVGPRLSGSKGLEVAIERVAATMRGLGAKVTLQPAKVPHWVRGAESAELTDYANHPAGITQKLRLVALGGSGATAATGLTGRIVAVSDIDDLKAHAAQVRGNIVVFTYKFDERLAMSGGARFAYGRGTRVRTYGPSEAAALGATAALVRSIGGADYRLPHTGVTIFKDGQTPIPAAALAAEDADLIARLAARGPVTMNLLLTPQILPDADSFNVIADWPGREKPDEYVVVSGHLDSWDLATGAADDGSGVLGAAAVIEVMQQLNLHPRRTIRFIGWTNEENGGRGSKAYFKSVSEALAGQTAAIESDSGAGRALGLLAALSEDSYAKLKPVSDALLPINAAVLTANAMSRELGSDIAPLQAAGVPGFAPMVDTRHYFDYHHTPADTLDKIDPEDLRSQVATMAVLAYFLAELPQPLAKLAPEQE